MSSIKWRRIGSETERLIETVAIDWMKDGRSQIKAVAVRTKKVDNENID